MVLYVLRHASAGTRRTNKTGYEQPILLSEALAPSATFEQFQALLADCAGYESVMVVGHSPNLVQFVGMLMQTPSAGEDCTKRPALVRMRKGAIARLNLDRGTAMLNWLLDPRVVRTLYASSTTRSRRKISRK